MVSRSAILLDLDSISQREIARRYRSLEVDEPHPITGILRASVLYADRLVLTDSQVFDGSLLLDLGPGGLAELLGYVHRSTAVSVSLRAATAAESLKELRASTTFEWQVHSLGWPRELVEQRQLAWARAIDGGKLAYSTRTPQPDFTSKLLARLNESTPGCAPALVARLVRTADSGPVTNRSEMRDIVARSAEAEPEREAVQDWWDAAYMDTIAMQHSAHWIGSASPGTKANPRTNTPAPGSRFEQLRVVDAISNIAVNRLAELSGSEFAALRASIRPIQDRQRENPTALNRLRLRIAVLDGTKPVRPVWGYIQSLGRVAAWIGVLMLVLVDTSGIAKWVLVVGSVVGVVIQAPFVELDVLRRSFSKHTRAFIRDPLGARG